MSNQRFDVCVTLVKPNAKQLLQPITTDVDRANQNSHQVHVIGGQVTVGLAFTSHWLRKNGANFTNQSQSTLKQNQNKSKIDQFYNQLETAYYICKDINDNLAKVVLYATNKLVKYIITSS